MTSYVEISVVVCTYNRADLLAGCLDSVCSQTLDKERYEVIVVDNRSSDHTQEIAQKFVGDIKNFKVVLEEKQGLSHARNRGWQEASGLYVAYLDDDAKAAPNWCEKNLAAFQGKSPGTVAVGGKILPWYRERPPAWFSDVLETRSWGETPGYLSQEQSEYGFSGSNMSFRRDVLSAYHGFNPAFGMSGNKMSFAEETELFSRLCADHYRFWYDPEIVVYHLVSPASLRLVNRFKRGYRSGAATASLKGRRLFSKLYLYNVRKLVFALAGFPIGSHADLSWRSRYAIWLGRVGTTLGYLLGNKI